MCPSRSSVDPLGDPLIPTPAVLGLAVRRGALLNSNQLGPERGELNQNAVSNVVAPFFSSGGRSLGKFPRSLSEPVAKLDESGGVFAPSALREILDERSNDFTCDPTTGFGGGRGPPGPGPPDFPVHRVIVERAVVPHGIVASIVAKIIEGGGVLALRRLLSLLLLLVLADGAVYADELGGDRSEPGGGRGKWGLGPGRGLGDDRSPHEPRQKAPLAGLLGLLAGKVGDLRFG